MPLYALDGIEPHLPPEGEFWIAPNAQVIGKVRLGANASIWFGVVLRGDNEEIYVGPGSNVQDNSVLHGMKQQWGVYLGRPGLEGNRTEEGRQLIDAAIQILMRLNRQVVRI